MFENVLGIILSVNCNNCSSNSYLSFSKERKAFPPDNHTHTMKLTFQRRILKTWKRCTKKNRTNLVLCLLSLFIFCINIFLLMKCTSSAIWYGNKMWTLVMFSISPHLLYRPDDRQTNCACVCLTGVHGHVCLCVCLRTFPNSEPTVRDALQPGNHHLLPKLRARQSCTFRWEGGLILLRNPQLHFQQWDEPGLQLHG